MISIKRRRIVAGMGAAVAAAMTGFAARAARAAMGPNDKFDLLIKGGEVLDPSQGLRAKRDIGMRYGLVEAIEADIPAARAARARRHRARCRARADRPAFARLPVRLGDRHSGRRVGAVPGHHHHGVGGDAGANNFAVFRRHIVAQTRTRLYAFVHIANIGLTGFPVPELFNIDFALPEAAAKAVAENADIVIGVKVRMSQNVIARHGLEPLKRAVRACELSGVSAKVMCHIGGVESVELMSQILDTLRSGDVLTHCFSGAPNDAGQFTNIVQDGKLLPAALNAKKRGVMFDVGHGGGSFDYTVAEAAIAQGCPPDTISSDIHVFSGNSAGMPYLTWVMSKFLNMGYTLEQVVAMATANPAKVINRLPKLGTLQVGAPADATLLDVVQGPVEFVDTRSNKRQGKVHIRPTNTIVAGVAFGRPYQAPFSTR